MNEKIIDLFKTLKVGLLWLFVGIGIMTPLAWRIRQPLVAHEPPQAIDIVIPERAEVRSSWEIKHTQRVDGRMVEFTPLLIHISLDEFRRRAAESQHSALISYATDDRQLAHHYWLSRGDGAWYHVWTSHELTFAGFWFKNKLEKVSDRKWIVHRKFDSSWGLLGIVLGGCIDFVGSLLLGEGIVRWFSKWYPRREPQS